MLSYTNLFKYFLFLYLINTIYSRCQPGQFPFLKNRCFDCPIRKASPDGIECYNCAPGYYASFSGSSRYQKCSPGTYAPYSGSSSCLRCTPGTYASEYGSTYCYVCPIGYYSNYGAKDCFPSYKSNYHYNYYTNAYAYN